MNDIPKPEILDADRVDRDDRADVTNEDHRSQAQMLAKALTESCEYADQLWEQLNAVRGYLLDSLPPEPNAAGPDAPTAASPTGPDDEEGWQRWVDAFAATTSVLCGAHGDSGFGVSQAHEEARMRRLVPHGGHRSTPAAGSPAAGGMPSAGSSAGSGASSGAGSADSAGTPAFASAPASPAAPAPAAPAAPAATPTGRTRSAVRAAGGAVVAVLALRGLTTLRRPSRNT